MSIFQTLNRLGILSVGRRPEWQRQLETEGPPAGPSAGIALSGAVKTLVFVSLREDPRFHAAKIKITSFDAATDYTITVDGTDYTEAGDTAPEVTLEALASAIGFDRAEAMEDTLTVRADETVSVSADGGTGDIEIVEEEATSADVQVWLYAARLGRWVLANEGAFDVETGGVTERLSTAGFDRIYVQVDADGTAVAYVGPGVME